MKSAKIIKLEKALEKCVRQHDKIINPICYTGNCPVCNKMKEIDEEIKELKDKINKIK